MNRTVVGIILAAGLSTRMGRPKLALEIAGIPIVLRVTRAALASSLERIVIVCGHHSNNIRRTLGDSCLHPKLAQVTNPHPELGMSESLRTGISTLSGETSGAMIILGDQPLITSEAIDELLKVWRKDATRIVIPTVRDRKTTPVIFPRALFDELRQVRGDVGGRDVIRRHQGQVVFVEIGAVYDDSDVDSTEDYERLANSLFTGSQRLSHRSSAPSATVPEPNNLKRHQQ